MRRALITCFDDFVVGTTAVYTASQLEDPLGAFDKVALQAVVDQVSDDSVRLTVALESSNDRRNWVQKSESPEIDQESLSSSGTNVLVATDAGTTPTLAYVRLRISLGGTNPVAHVKLTVCLRDDA